MDTNHAMTCGCCNAGTVNVRVDDRRQFHPDRCSNCGRTSGWHQNNPTVDRWTATVLEGNEFFAPGATPYFFEGR